MDMANSKMTQGVALKDTGNGPASHQGESSWSSRNRNNNLDRNWEIFPPQAKRNILDTPDGMIPTWKLVKFWSSPQNIESTRGLLAATVCGAAWYLVLIYLELGMFKEARALTITGSFIQQCYNSSIEYIQTLCESSDVIPDHKWSYFIRGRNSTRSPHGMKSFIQTFLPTEYTQMVLSLNSTSRKGHLLDYIDQISDDWKGNSSVSRNGHHRSSSTNSGAQIKLFLVDDTNEYERHSFDFGSSTNLKVLFNEYADKQGVSLRSLRFSHAGKTLFLSSAGHKTPDELGMRNLTEITVHKPQEIIADDCAALTPTSKSTKTKKRLKGKTKGKSKSKRSHKLEEPVKTIEEYKVQHSKQLTKIHEEAYARFKTIRQRLNNMVLERSPKIKSRCPPSKSQTHLLSAVNCPFKEGIRGKAGKSRYIIQVGEEQNLYKNKKTCASPTLSSLDLHGCRRDEALVKLDESLKIWVSAAMQGSYPFVKTAVIVCGSGNQILSETVQEWIRSNDKVSNAPKARSTRRRGLRWELV